MPCRRLAAPFIIVLLVAATFYWLWWQAPPAETSPGLDQEFAAGMKAVAQRDFERAHSAIEALQNGPEYRGHARVLRAALALKQDDPAAAVRELASKPVRPEIRITAALVLANAFYRVGDLAKAEEAARFVAQEEPDNAEGHRLLAAVYYDLGANAASIMQLREVIRLDPDDFRPHHLLGQIDFDAEHYQEAVEELRAALKRKPPHAKRLDMTLSLARAYLKTKRYSEATLLLKRDAKINASLLALLSEALWAQGESDEAAKMLHKAARIDPDDRFVLLQRARLAIYEGRIRSALVPLKKRLAADPHDLECRHQLALCYQKLGDSKRYEAESARFKESQRIRKELSRLSDEAIRNPRDAGVRDRIAELYTKLGRPKLAKVYQRAAAACRRRAETRPGSSASHDRNEKGR